MKIDIYYCADEDGQCKVFLSRPLRSINQDNRGIWTGERKAELFVFLNYLIMQMGLTLPQLKWKDEPVRIRIKVRTKIFKNHFIKSL